MLTFNDPLLSGMEGWGQLSNFGRETLGLTGVGQRMVPSAWGLNKRNSMSRSLGKSMPLGNRTFHTLTYHEF